MLCLSLGTCLAIWRQPMSVKFLMLLLFSLSNLVNAQNGRIISKQQIDLKHEYFWSGISVDDELKPEYQYLANLDFFQISYLSDSIEVEGCMILPKKEGNYPVVIFNRGGNRDYSRLSIATLINYTSQLAAEGYVIIASNYREQDEFGGNEINDVLILQETVKSIPKANPKRIGMFGWSRGGMMTYLALKNSDSIQTAIVGNSPTDLFSTIQERPHMEMNPISECIPDYWANKDEELKKRSAIFWADSLSKKTSLLMLCGTKDKLVSHEQSLRMAERLSEIGYNYKLLEFDTDHFFSDKKTELNKWVIEWFNKELKHVTFN